MRALASTLGGVCITYDDSHQAVVIDAVDKSRVPEATAHLRYSACNDWETIDAPDQDTLIEQVSSRHSCAQVTALLEACLVGVSTSLRSEILDEVERHLIAAGTELLERQLLKAPFHPDIDLRALVTASLSDGQQSTAALLDRVREVQPLLNRLADAWLALPQDLFEAFDGGRQEVWCAAVSSGIVLNSIHLDRFDMMRAEWGKLITHYTVREQLAAIALIQAQLAHAIFPHSDTPPLQPDAPSEHIARTPTPRRSLPSGHAARQQYESVMRQLRAIADCVGRGDDATAHRYLRELISEQLSYKHGEKHAVKSLCNIAQHCAEMYRTDFEHTCLVTAIDVAPTDGWAYTQFADHYKRLGQFEKALECLDNASKYGEDRIAQRSRADIYAMKGNYEEAFRIYDEITDIATDATLRTAKADLLRRMGKLEEAEAEYDLLETDGLAGDRVCAGRAEIAKRLGDMEAARAIYERILEYDSIGDEAKYIYSLALTNVLLRLADYEAAFRHADTAVQTKPFAHQARLTRAAAAGLLGDVSGALDGLPIVGQTSAFNEWIGDYVKGGLLLLLDRNDDARKSLIGKLNRKCKFADEEGKSILRLGAAACLLRSRHGVAGAAMILSQIESGHDAYAGWVRHALEYHVAVAMRNIADIDRLRQELSTAADPGIQELVAAIGSRAWDSVTRHEAQMILRLAS